MAKPKSSDVTVILADPPWQFKTYSAKGRKKSPKYDTMPTPDICALGPTVKQLAGKHAYLCMWATAPMLPDAMAVMASWGFTYKSYRIWCKSKLGTGYHVRSDTEILLIGARGQPGVPGGKKEATTFFGAPVERRHSSKPSGIHRWLAAGFPEAKKIELFARLPVVGWHGVGADLGLVITPTGVIPFGSVAGGLGYNGVKVEAENPGSIAQGETRA